MKRTRIKFCGIRRCQDADAAVALGVDAIGLVLVPGAARTLDLTQASKIRRRLPAFVECVALLRDPQPAWAERVISQIAPDLLQFHGSEPASLCRQFGVRWIKAVAMAGETALEKQWLEYQDAAGLVLDGHAPGELGGQGRRFDWARAGGWQGPPLIVAGGLTAENVGAAIAQARPFAVDVSSGIEADAARQPGIKDFGKMAAFVAAVRRADTAVSEPTPTSTG